MKNKLVKALVLLKHQLVYIKWNFLTKINKSKFRTNPSTDFVVSIASYPKRAHLLPAVFEALNTQTVVPKKWILVLSEEEWPEQKLPIYLEKLLKRGLEIIWVRNNSFAVKKLVPVLEKYPSLAIVTIDDDIIYHKFLLEGLIEKSLKERKAIIGYVGKSMLRKESNLQMYYREKLPANLNTPSEQVYLIGWGGIYYPPNSLNEKVINMEAIHQIVPGRGSDIWFWAAAIANDTNQICLGMPKNYNLGIPIPQNTNTQPKDLPQTNILLNRFQMAIDFFGIRDTLVATLPNKNG
ncbi:MAG: glycosyltransferase [Flavobacteriaceae bacterium]|nr:glycosyltransferase [Flavobacteriaceae bacterium]